MTTEEKLRATVKIVLTELGLTDRVSIDNVQRQVYSDRYDVDLNVTASEFPRFVVDPNEALNAERGTRTTPESYVPFIHRSA